MQLPDLNSVLTCFAAVLAMNGAHASLLPASWVRATFLEQWIDPGSEAARQRVRWLGAVFLASGIALLALNA